MKRTDFVLRMNQILLRRRDGLRRTLASELAWIGHDHDLESVGDSFDEAQDAADDEVCSALLQTETRELRAIENALARMRDGQYGKCENCSGRIALARLQALPFATLCIRCQRESEMHDKTAGPVGHWSRVVDQADDRDWTSDDLNLVLS